MSFKETPKDGIGKGEILEVLQDSIVDFIIGNLRTIFEAGSIEHFKCLSFVSNDGLELIVDNVDDIIFLSAVFDHVCDTGSFSVCRYFFVSYRVEGKHDVVPV